MKSLQISLKFTSLFLSLLVTELYAVDILQDSIPVKRRTAKSDVVLSKKALEVARANGALDLGNGPASRLAFGRPNTPNASQRIQAAYLGDTNTPPRADLLARQQVQYMRQVIEESIGGVTDPGEVERLRTLTIEDMRARVVETMSPAIHDDWRALKIESGEMAKSPENFKNIKPQLLYMLEARDSEVSDAVRTLQNNPDAKLPRATWEKIASALNEAYPIKDGGLRSIGLEQPFKVVANGEDFVIQEAINRPASELSPMSLQGNNGAQVEKYFNQNLRPFLEDPTKALSDLNALNKNTHRIWMLNNPWDLYRYGSEGAFSQEGLQGRYGIDAGAFNDDMAKSGNLDEAQKTMSKKVQKLVAEDFVVRKLAAEGHSDAAAEMIKHLSNPKNSIHNIPIRFSEGKLTPPTKVVADLLKVASGESPDELYRKLYQMAADDFLSDDSKYYFDVDGNPKTSSSILEANPRQFQQLLGFVDYDDLPTRIKALDLPATEALTRWGAEAAASIDPKYAALLKAEKELVENANKILAKFGLYFDLASKEYRVIAGFSLAQVRAELLKNKTIDNKFKGKWEKLHAALRSGDANAQKEAQKLVRSIMSGQTNTRFVRAVAWASGVGATATLATIFWPEASETTEYQDAHSQNEGIEDEVMLHKGKK